MRTEDLDFPCSQTFRDYYHLIADDGDRERHAGITRQQQIERGLIFPIEMEPEFRRGEKLGYADSKEVRAVVEHLEGRVNELDGFKKMAHTHSKKVQRIEDGF